MDARSPETSGLSGLIPTGAELAVLATGATWSEGPVWMPSTQSVRWSDIPGNRILEYSAVNRSVSVYASDVEFTNGRTLDHDGSVIQCSHGRRRIERDRDGVVTPIVDSYNGVRLNSPNDVVVAADGSIWFSDPPYGIVVSIEGHPGEREYGDNFVFRHDVDTGDTRPVVIDVEEPNGLAFSPDGSILYVSDTSAALRTDGGNHHIRAYDVDGTRCKNGRIFAVIGDGISDGFRVDIEGNVWTSTASGVSVYSPDGRSLGHIAVPEVVSNLCFGGPDGTTLFITASTSLYSIATSTRDAASTTPARPQEA
ncbi:SMP-30/gluconolactonase/LRE family protein [Agreia pratensis]|uniref:Gluconolactonase n=1 Tax=Agreia pratensis TaxID=150121 RepID=A0A1X7KKI1_9MICO|nr:SMP-30/gluconolactonase/LRE family protein [Agreia pratensis]SMG41138.1 gluconolactonase [Agreia pratensis]